MSKRDKLRDAPERRSLALADFELRTNGDELSLDGYASVYSNRYSVLGGPPFGWKENVSRSAFDKTLSEKPDLHLLINHEGMPLARTKSGTLLLTADGTGLRVQAPSLDRRDPDVQRLEVKMARGDMDEMSFAFRVKNDEWNDDESERTLTEVSLHKGDVSVVNFGANPATSAQLNSIRAAFELMDAMDDEALRAELDADPEMRTKLERDARRVIAAVGHQEPASNGSVARARAVLEGLTEL